MSFVYPVSNPYVTSPYGWRTLGGKKSHHNGTDFRAPTGTKLVSVGAGVVSGTGRNHPSAGNWVEIRLDNGALIGYSHLSRVNVSKGAKVKAGTTVGLSGATGNVTGPHLHFYVKVNGSFVNPEPWLKKVTTRVKLVEDGFWGESTTEALQIIFGTTADRKVSSQPSSQRKRNPGLTSGWQWTSKPKGSQLISAMQRKLKVKVTGVIDTATINALSKRYNIKGDGKLDGPSLTIRAMQKALNKGKF